ncbi:ABC transporter ATP-binding protein, partial [Mycobacterium sp. ITM-2017-0098]
MTTPESGAAPEVFEESIAEIASVHREIQVDEGEVLLQTTDLTVQFGGL